MSSDDANSSPTGVTIQTNIATFFDSSKTIVDVIPNGIWMVSDGQPFTPPPTVTRNLAPTVNSFTIEFDAGRDDTSAVADQFNTFCGGAGNEWCTNSPFASSPGELNFFFGLTLWLEATEGSAEVTVYLGQGNSGFANNWWIGGSCISKSGLLTATIGGQTVNLSIKSNEINSFDFQFADASS